MTRGGRTARGNVKAATRITSKGQVVIPKAVRDRLRWRAGTQLEVDTLPGPGARLRPMEDDPVSRAFGFLTEGDPIGDLEAEHRAEIEADERPRRRR